MPKTRRRSLKGTPSHAKMEVNSLRKTIRKKKSRSNRRNILS